MKTLSFLFFFSFCCIVLLLRVTQAMNNEQQRQLDQQLLHALVESDREQVKTLVKNGANINAKDSAGFTPLHYAIRYNLDVDFVDCLLRSGANKDARSIDGYTPLHVATLNVNFPLVQFLLSRGADSLIRDTMGMRAFDYALSDPIRDLLAMHTRFARRGVQPEATPEPVFEVD